MVTVGEYLLRTLFHLIPAPPRTSPDGDDDNILNLAEYDIRMIMIA